ncbi:MAG TPA: hypothetical protein PKK48_09405, partial [Phycisphaerae bacterium]|nr:hypothetical protein [Phycisphaerae bacterium]
MKHKNVTCLNFARIRLPEYHMTVAREFKFKPHKHKGFFEIDYVFEGVLTEEINNRKYVFPAGTLVFIREK